MRVKVNKAREMPVGEEVNVKGWVKSIRNQKTFSFIDLNDGSSLAGCCRKFSS